MKNPLEEILNILKQEGIEIDEVELSEVVWLLLQTSNTTPMQSSFKDMLLQKLHDWIQRFKHKDKKQSIPQTHSSSARDNIDSPPIDKTPQKRKRPTQKAPLVASSQGKHSLPFRTPVNRYIDNDNVWIKALRHFRDKKPSRQASIFDEESSADYLASTRVFVPQFAPSYDKRFEAVFIIDISTTMQIWQEPIAEFLRGIQNYAIFHTVTILYLDGDTSTLYRTSDKKQPLIEEWYRRYGKEAVIFICSDMLAMGWCDQTLLRSISRWQKRSPLALVQMLPYRLYRATILNYATLDRLHNTKPFGNNHYLKAQTSKSEHRLKLPLLSFEASSFDAYGRVFRAKTNNTIRGAIFKPLALPKIIPMQNRVFESDEERVIDFYNTASQEAKLLAELLSVVPLSFEIMKIVRREIAPPHITHTHLSEVFMAHLIDKRPNSGIYRFYKSDESQDGVREILLKMLGKTKAYETIKAISRFVSNRKGAFDFMAFVKNPDSLTRQSQWSEIDREFAYISASLLKNMGGEYAKLADTLIEYIEYEDDEDETQETIHPQTKSFLMGSNEADDEKPIHKVTINYDFEIGKYPVTVGEFRAFAQESGYITEAEKGHGAYVYDGGGWKQKKMPHGKIPILTKTIIIPSCVSLGMMQKPIVSGLVNKRAKTIDSLQRQSGSMPAGQGRRHDGVSGMMRKS